MSSLPSVAIVIVNWNGLSVTDECLQSLEQLDYPNYETILVDNGSDDGSAPYFEEKYPHIHLLALEENTGFTGGNNAGIQQALDHAYDYILLLNNDTIITDALLLNTMIQVCEGDNTIGMACPTIYFDSPKGKVWYAGGWLSLWRGWGHFYETSHTAKPQNTGYATGCCLLVRTETVREIGLLNDAYFLSVEDVEWSMRAQKKNWKTIYIPHASIVHKDSVASRSESKGKFSPIRVYCGFRNSIWFVREYAALRQKLLTWPFIFTFRFLYQVSGYLLLGRWNKLKAVTRGLRDGLFSKRYDRKANNGV